MTIEERVENNIGLIYSQLKRFKMLQDPDAESLGYEALFNAAVAFDESRNIKFSTFATSCIYNALGSYLRHKLRKRQLHVVSYNNVHNAPDGSQNEYLDTLSYTEGPEEIIMTREYLKEVMECIDEAYKLLRSNTQKRIIDTWVKSEWKASAIDIAEVAQCSQPYVTQTLATFRTTIRRMYNDRNS